MPRAARARPGRCALPQCILGDVVRGGGGVLRRDERGRRWKEAYRRFLLSVPAGCPRRDSSFKLGAFVKGGVSGESSRRARVPRPPSAVWRRPTGPPPTSTCPRLLGTERAAERDLGVPRGERASERAADPLLGHRTTTSGEAPPAARPSRAAADSPLLPIGGRPWQSPRTSSPVGWEGRQSGQRARPPRGQARGSSHRLERSGS